MKKIFIPFLFISTLSFSQGLINNGARIVFSGAAHLYIDGTTGNYLSQASSVPTQGNITPSASSSITLLGNWTNNSANNAFTTDGGGVVLAGAAQTINGTNATAFYNLSLAGNGVKTLAVNSTTVGGQATFTGVLSVGSSTLDLNSNRIDITNPATGAITRSSGYVISETNAAINPSIIRWYHRTMGGSKVYPFGVGGSYIPFTFSISAAMANPAAYVDVSTRSTVASDNLPWAGASNVAAVSQMYSPNVPYADGSIPAVIDRWWDITNSHAVTADATFSYRASENTLNAMYSPGLIGAQYWNGTSWMPNNAVIGSAVVATSGVGAVTAPNLSTFCPWVLSALLSPLPIELLNFDAKCVNNDIVLDWCTASETNNNYFTISQSMDGVNFTDIGYVFGNGTTTEKHCYQYITSSLSNLNYFRLTQTDNDGATTNSKIISIAACQNIDENIIIAHGGTKEVGVILNALNDQVLELHVHNSLGQLVEIRSVDVKKGYNNIRVNLYNVSNALYYISLYDDSSRKLTSKKIVVTDLIK
jgi:hypothetical protein